ncbi:MAG: helix-turn-helix domain-containing protein [Coleofasciculaceae cyanobacterium]
MQPPRTLPISPNSEESKTCQLLTPFQRKLLQKSLQQDDFAEQYRQRIEIMLLADEGKSQVKICQTVGCCHGTARYWILMAKAGNAHQWEEQPLGRPKVVNEQYLKRLRELASQSPKEFGYSFRRWTANWLSKHLAKEFGIEVTARHIHRLLKEMGLSTRPKANNKEANLSQPSLNDHIAIRNLDSVPATDSLGLWLLNSSR